ncbi:MAG: DUF167 domain-containing protein [Acidobacteria bacterium]|nr:DUF167 domain-containing protein [Acidobacteriota bacterium]
MSSEKPAAETIVSIRVIPRSPRTRVDGMRGGAFLIRLSAPPLEGAANDALVAFLADTLDLPRSRIRIVSGEKSRDKRVGVSGLDEARIAAKLIP